MPPLPILLLLAALCAFAPSAAGQEPDEAARVVATVQALFDAMEAADPDGAAAVLDPSARLEGVVPRADAAPSGSPMTPEAFVDMLRSAAPGVLVERMWDPEVRVDGPVAQLWAPYDFYRGGELSHCGVDAVHLVRRESGWRIVAITWTTARPPACELHPEGPPEGS